MEKTLLSEPKRLLIADDDPAVLSALEEFFLDRGYAVRTATNGFEALAEIHDRIPDILLSDLNMPRMSGFDLLAVVSRRFPNMHLIAMTGTFSGRERMRGLAVHSVYEKGSGSAALLSAIESGSS
jgi:CheY-like chemotaxis protein